MAQKKITPCNIPSRSIKPKPLRQTKPFAMQSCFLLVSLQLTFNSCNEKESTHHEDDSASPRDFILPPNLPPKRERDNLPAFATPQHSLAAYKSHTSGVILVIHLRGNEARGPIIHLTWIQDLLSPLLVT